MLNENMSPGKSKSKPQQQIISQLSERLCSKRQQITNVGQKGDQGNISILMVVMYIGIDSTENSIEISQKIKNRSIILFNNSIPRYVGME